MVCGADRSYVDVLRQVLPLAELREGVTLEWSACTW